MLKTLIGALIGFALTVAFLLLLDGPPHWIGDGAKAHPVQASIFLIGMSIAAAVLAFDSTARPSLLQPPQT